MRSAYVFGKTEHSS